MRLSPHFTLQELTKSQTALRMGLNNTPNPEQVEALKRLCEAILEPCRKHFKRSFVPSSGFRSKALCKAIGSSPKSQHAKGEAVDFEIRTVPNYELAVFIRDNLEFDQLILEHYDGVDPNSGWVHVSYRGDGKNRKECLSYDGSTYTKGLGNA